MMPRIALVMQRYSLQANRVVGDIEHSFLKTMDLLERRGPGCEVNAPRRPRPKLPTPRQAGDNLPASDVDRRVGAASASAWC